MARKQPVRYAVVGLGHIAQIAVLPAFKHARRNSQLVALVSNDAEKRQALSAEYDVRRTYTYEQYDECLRSGDVDAVYIALPNSMHCEYAVRAAEAGVHVLCEKPMAVTVEECEKMRNAAEAGDVRLMVAYRLHFDKANLRAIEIVHSGELGEPRIFNSVFSMQVREGDIRTQRGMGGGTLYDIGIYCINAARYLFRDEPTEVFARSAKSEDHRFTEIDEMTSAVLRFPGDCLAAFTSSFGASDVSSYRVVGTRGDLRVEPAYEYAERLCHHLTIDGKTRKKSFSRRDQFGPELIYFSDCVQKHREPEPSGLEGLADVRVIEALYLSAAEGRPVQLPPLEKPERPSMEQEISRPPVSKPELVHVESPSL